MLRRGKEMVGEWSMRYDWGCAGQGEELLVSCRDLIQELR